MTVHRFGTYVIKECHSVRLNDPVRLNKSHSKNLMTLHYCMGDIKRHSSVKCGITKTWHSALLLCFVNLWLEWLISSHFIECQTRSSERQTRIKAI